jgi:hypothetical protein
MARRRSMTSTPSDTTTSIPLREIKAAPDSVRAWYYLECEWRAEGLIRGPFTVEDMRILLKDGTIDEKTPVRYFYSQWHRLRDVSAILAITSRKTTPKRVRSARSKIQEVAALGVLAIILELILVHWTWPANAGGLVH